MSTVMSSPSAVLPSVRGSLNSSSASGSVMRVHVLAGAQAGELRLLLVVLGADLHERSVAAQAHLTGLPVFGSMPSSRACATCSRGHVLLGLLDLRP